jgi:Zn-dependent protease with chaperone function
LKLGCLCLAAFFLIHSALALAMKLATPAALRIAARMNARAAARFLLSLRIFPAGFSALIVAGLCAPSYLRLEPRTATAEEIGFLGFALSVFAIALWLDSITRGLAAMILSIRYLQHCRRVGVMTRLPAERLPVWLVEEPATLFAIAGVTHPQLLISRQVMGALSADELDAALRHERAHWTSRDNLKRLLLALTPGMLPLLHGFEGLERSWARYTERAADDDAVGGDATRSLFLATALVRVGRLGIAPRESSLAAPLLAEDEDLPARVQRLLSETPTAGAPQGGMGLTAAAAVLSAAVFTLGGLQPALLYPVHRVLEHLIR